MPRSITVNLLKSVNPDPSTEKAHHVGSPPASFKNPWPSFQGISTASVFQKRFGNNAEKNFVPVPQGQNGARSDQLVTVRKPDWSSGKKESLKATWIGHASFLVELPTVSGASRGIRILFDPVFSERTSPVGWVGPKRYTPTPCALDELPDVDLVCISHNHYDHLDIHTMTEIFKRRTDKIHFLVALNNKAWFTQNVCPPEQVTELDWWEQCEMAVDGIGKARFTAAPCQHGSARSPFDKDRALWCSWAVEAADKKLYFAGDTGYQAVDTPSPVPTFAQLGKVLGPFDLALLPIGLFKPQSFMGGVHCSPEQSLQIHKDVKSRLSIGMHYGTVRGGLSASYEDVREPPRRWREAAEKEGLWRGGGVEGAGDSIDSSKGGVCLCDIGETVSV